jgi:hypothetical protein
MAFRFPVDNVQISQGFGGNADYYRQFGQKGHNGIDLAVPAGTPVFAPDDATVEFEGWGQNHSWMGSPAGICILMNCGGSYAAVAHLQSTTVNKGQGVSKGQLIGYAGATGAATGSHVHFEMLPLRPDFKNGFAGRINIMPYVETAKLATEDEIRQAFREILERDADAGAVAHYKNYRIDFVRQDLAASQEKRQLEARKAAAALDAANRAADEARKAQEVKAAQEAAAKAQADLDRIAKEEADAKAAAEAKASSMENIVKENNTILKQIAALLEKLLSVFNFGGK